MHAAVPSAAATDRASCGPCRPRSGRTIHVMRLLRQASAAGLPHEPPRATLCARRGRRHKRALAVCSTTAAGTARRCVLGDVGRASIQAARAQASRMSSSDVAAALMPCSSTMSRRLRTALWLSSSTAGDAQRRRRQLSELNCGAGHRRQLRLRRHEKDALRTNGPLLETPFGEWMLCLMTCPVCGDHGGDSPIESTQ